MESIEWAEHFARMPGIRLPKQILLSEIASGKRPRGASRPQFKDQFLKFERLVLHTEARFLSNGNGVKRFVALSYNVFIFSSETKHGQKPVDARSDTFYLSGIFEKLNILNKKRQANDVTLFSCK